MTPPQKKLWSKNDTCTATCPDSSSPTAAVQAATPQLNKASSSSPPLLVRYSAAPPSSYSTHLSCFEPVLTIVSLGLTRVVFKPRLAEEIRSNLLLSMGIPPLPWITRKDTTTRASSSPPPMLKYRYSSLPPVTFSRPPHLVS
ncbi:hypothetical protein E2C01_028893 [Portunus trituberculatus]|uniref:Uncharacterized protein n=1 Tax=Portunus trituberculatus TaxID=210409 RepID=A0A5B7EQR0_PORTR|nr:hypothetical protein [Portunus trituberculatus]